MIDGVLVHSKRSTDIWGYIYIYIYKIYLSLESQIFHPGFIGIVIFGRYVSTKGVNKFSSISWLVEQLWLKLGVTFILISLVHFAGKHKPKPKFVVVVLNC